MAISVSITPLLKQVIGDVYLFELISVDANMQSNTVGCIVANRKTGAYSMTLSSVLSKSNEVITKEIVEQIKETIIHMGEVFY